MQLRMPILIFSLIFLCLCLFSGLACQEVREKAEKTAEKAVERVVRGPTQAPPAAGKLLVRGYIAVKVGTSGTLKGISPPVADIYLPNVQVVLRDTSSGTRSDRVITDLSGRFTTQVKGPGSYQVCWEAKGFEAGCSRTTVSIVRVFHNIGKVSIPAPRQQDSVALYGRVTLADGSSARAFEPLENINSFATISLLDSTGNPVYEIPVNNFDQYLIPSVKLGQNFQLRIHNEDYDHSQWLELGNPSVLDQNINFKMLNYPPKIDPLIALDNDQVRVLNAKAGETVILNARVSDRDHNTMKFLWRVSSGTLSSQSDPEPKWTLPNKPGNYAANLIVYDSKGGYARSSLDLPIDPEGLVFSGKVSGTDMPSLEGAEVNVNGRIDHTDSRGYFRLKVPDDMRFVMTIRMTGYAFASNLYYDGVVGGRWQLTKADVFKDVDPSESIDLRNDRQTGQCPGLPSARLNWQEHPVLAVPQHQDGRGNVIPAMITKSEVPQVFPMPSPQIGIRGVKRPQIKVPGIKSPQIKVSEVPGPSKNEEGLPGLPSTDPPSQRRGCGPGVRILIPADSLRDANGNPPNGLVDIQLSTVDLQTPNQMPGNYTVLLPNQETRVMQSYGAASIEISAGGTMYNRLKPNAKATLILPVDDAQIKSGGPLEPTIPLLTYDESRGIWEKSGSASLQMVDGRPTYVAMVSHFSAINTDLIKSGQACLAVQNNDMPANYDLEYTIPQTGGAAPVNRITPGVVGGNSETVILNLPTDTNIVLVPIRTTDDNPDQNNLPMGVFVVNTGAAQNPDWPTVSGGFANEPVGPPYYTEAEGVPNGACSTKVVLSDLSLEFYPTTPPNGAFLHGLTGFAAVNLDEGGDPAFPGDANATLRDAVEAASADYRAQIDPRTLRPTLSCFKVANRMPLKAGEACPEHATAGFVPEGDLAETTAVYANTFDLGFGREMHCVQDGEDVACWVSNYDQPPPYKGPGEGTDVDQAQNAAEGFNGDIAPDATVAMEYSRIEDDTPDGDPITFSDEARVVKFYVFGADGNPADKADLDDRGNRPLPQLCMVCHGGFIPNAGGSTITSAGVSTPVFGSRDDVKLNAKFLPFDLSSFTYASEDLEGPCDPATAPEFSKCSQQEAFRDLNQMVKVAPPPDVCPPTCPVDLSTNVIQDLYDTWYPDDNFPQQEEDVVPLWSADALHRDIYTGVVARSCRTCHVANPEPNLRFEQPVSADGLGFDGALGKVQSRVCVDHTMPHARRTHDLFWTSVGPNQAGLLQAYGDTLQLGGWQDVGAAGVDSDKLLCGNEYTQGGGAPVVAGAFNPVAIIFSGSCVGCHNAANAAPGSSFDVAGLDLEGLEAYDNIVGVFSNQLPTMELVDFGADTENTSYLWHKINNTHLGLTPPGSDSAMPRGTPGLVTTDPELANAIREWIQGGALP